MLQHLVMKYLSFLLCLFIFSSCLSDEEKRVQTDQTFEGEELFSLTFSLDEHVSYALHSFDYYRDTANYSNIAGCPVISVDDLAKEVVLVFGEGECATNRALRSGKLRLTYVDSLGLSKKVRIGYDDYWVMGVKVDGLRMLEQTDSTATTRTLQDSVSGFMITDANRSTSKMEGVFTHEVVVSNDSIKHFETKGAGLGRNLAGRHFEMEVIEPKRFSSNCLLDGFQVAESGQERWIFERTVEANVVHTVNFQRMEDCDHTAQIHLHDGDEILKKQ